MTDTREKLVELVHDARMNALWHNAQNQSEYITDMLIDNGVTVQEWIPVTERLPDIDGSYIVRTTSGAVTTSRFYVGKTYPPTHYRPTEYHSPTKWQSNRHVTHWMPLPKPPKGE